MGTFGEFEPQRPVYRSASSAVYLAHQPANPQGQFALKVFSSHTPFGPLTLGDESQLGLNSWDYDFSGSDEHLKAALASRLELLRLQRDLALAVGDKGHWAPVHDMGLSSDGPFAILDWYPRSIESLSRAGGGAMLGAGSIHFLLVSIVQGLLELRDAFGRPHGNLKESNVLLQGVGRQVTQWRVRLTDPAAPDLASEPQDVAALGHLLYRCVTREAFKVADFQVQDSEHWRRLGRRATRWREFCAKLVNPVPSFRPTLDQVRVELGRLKERKLLPSAVKRYGGLTILATIAIGVVGYWMWFTQNRVAWQRYDQAYQTWYRWGRAAVSPTDPIGKDGYARLNSRFSADRKTSEHRDDPQMMQWWQAWNAVRAVPPEELSARNPLAAGELAVANQQVDDLGNAIRNWPARLRLERAAKVMGEIGWAAPAQYLAAKANEPLLILEGKREVTADSFAGALAIIADLNNDLGQYSVDGNARLLDSIVHRLDNLENAPRAGSDPALAGLRSRVGKALASDAARFNAAARAGDSVEKTNDLATVLNTLDTNLKKVGDAIDVIDDSINALAWAPRGDTLAEGGHPSIDQVIGDLQDRIEFSRQIVRNSPFINSPIERQIDQKLAALRDGSILGTLDRLLADEKEWSVRFLKPGEVEAERSRVNADLTQLHDAQAAFNQIKRLPFPHDYRQISAELTKLAARVNQIDVEARRTAIASMMSRGQLAEQGVSAGIESFKLSQKTRFSITTSAADPLADAIATTWADWLPILAAATAGKSDAERQLTYDRAANTLQDFARTPAPSDPGALADLPEVARADVAAFEQPYFAELRAKWPQLLAAALKRAPSASLLSKSGDAETQELRALIATQAGVYLENQQRLREAATKAGIVRGRLLRCERFDEISPSIGRATEALPDPQKLGGSAADQIIKSDPRLRQLLDDAAPIARVEQLVAKLESKQFRQSDRKELAHLANDAGASPELRRNAWWALQRMTQQWESAQRQLPDGVQPWPADDNEWQNEFRIRRAIRAELDQRSRQFAVAGRPTGWVDAVKRELDQTGPPTLRRYIEMAVGATAAGEVRATLRRLANAEVLKDFSCPADFESTLPALINVRKLVEQALAQRPGKGDARPADEEAARKEMVQLRDGLIAAIAADPAKPVQYKAMIDALSDRIARESGPARPGFESAGPGRLGWKPMVVRPETVRYMTPGPNPVAIEFARVSGQPGSPGCFLATTELSIEMTNAIMQSAIAAKHAHDDWRELWSLVARNEQSPVSNEILRLGAHAWDWDPKAKTLIPATSWMRGSSNPHYPKPAGGIPARLPQNAPGGEPQWDHPMHRLSLGEAVYLATLANARVPSASEWQAAYKMEMSQPTPLWNRRDISFKTQVEHVKANYSGMPPLAYPDAKIYLPKSTERDPLIAAAAVTDPALPPDGVLWFCPVNSDGSIDAKTGKPTAGTAPGKVFKHLVGNVAEIVTFKPETPPAPRLAQSTDPDDFRQAVDVWTKAEGRLGVIGASALSPPDYLGPGGVRIPADPSKPFPLDGSSNTAYTDLGLRLAIDVAGIGESIASWYDAWLPPIQESLATPNQ